MKDFTPFEIREYGRSELASLYSPNIEPMSAWRKFRRWMMKSPHLIENLEALGYDNRQHIFTPIQVRMIIAALGEP